MTWKPTPDKTGRRRCGEPARQARQCPQALGVRLCSSGSPSPDEAEGGRDCLTLGGQKRSEPQRAGGHRETTYGTRRGLPPHHCCQSELPTGPWEMDEHPRPSCSVRLGTHAGSVLRGRAQPRPLGRRLTRATATLHCLLRKAPKMKRSGHEGCREEALISG